MDSPDRQQWISDATQAVSAQRQKMATVREDERPYLPTPCPRYPRTSDERERILLRYPRLCAHLICVSLGYFTPRMAACAVQHFQAGTMYSCEWYGSMAGLHNYDPATYIRINKAVMARAWCNRHRHNGPMDDYLHARAAVLSALGGHGPEFFSW